MVSVLVEPGRPAVLADVTEQDLRTALGWYSFTYPFEDNIAFVHDDDGIANDVGLVYAKQPFVVCFLSTHTIERDFEIFIRQTAWDIFKDCGGAPEA